MYTINSIVENPFTFNGAYGVIDLQDAIAALKVLAALPSGVISNSGDINSDGKIGAAEIIYVLKEISDQ